MENLKAKTRVWNEEKISSSTIREKIEANMKDRNFAEIILSGDNFGSGDNITQTIEIMKANGIKAIIASSFAEGFYEALLSLNILPIIVSADCGRVMSKYFAQNIEQEIEINAEAGFFTVEGNDISMFIIYDEVRNTAFFHEASYRKRA